jgi:hypothetical protein
MKKVIAAGVAVSILLALSCKDAVSPDTGLDYTAETPRQCIISLEYALNNYEAGLYYAMFAPNFVFYFDDDDVGAFYNGYTIPESWGYEEECRAIANMLRPYEEGGAYELEAYANTNYMGDPPDGFDVYYTSDVYFRILIFVNSMWGMSNDDEHYIEFAKTTDNGESYWRITEWRNYQDSEEYDESIGFIKAYYYSLNPLPE